MIDQSFRAWLSTRVRPVMFLYKSAALSPNAVTILGLLFALSAAFATSQGLFWIALLLWWIGRFFDGTDGIYAREIGKTSDFGGYLDILCDMASYSAMMVGFAVALPALMSWWISILVLYILCITSALALGSLEQKAQAVSDDNRSLRLAAGIAEGGETGIFYSLILIAPTAAEWFCLIWCVILISTVLARTLLARRTLKH
jgi:phosphatidylglycerophosphate synthase